MKTPRELEAGLRAVNEILMDILEVKSPWPCAREWKSSMHCYQVRAWIDHEGDIGVTAYIDGASPDCRELRQHVQNQLVSLGFGSVEVVTEW